MTAKLPIPKLDALPMGAHRLFALTDEELFRATGVRIAFTSRQGGVSEGMYASMNPWPRVGDDPAAVKRNCEILLESLDCADAAIVSPKQVHGSDIVAIESAADANRVQEVAEEGADGLYVEDHGVAAMLGCADCLLVTMVDPQGRFAVVHAGWRGAIAGIAGKAAKLFENPAECNAYLGPCIHSECFEVSAEIAQSFKAEFGDAAAPDDRHVDLVAAVRQDLQRAGLCPERIADSGICTKCNSDQYFSYRATDGKCGRQVAFACRK